jgi:type IV secretion system protein VirB10
MMMLRNLLVATAAVGLFAQEVPDPGPYLAQQPTVQLPQRPAKAPVASPEAKLAQEERDARFLMDLQIANQTRAAQSSETVRQNQEKASAAMLEYYARLLEPQGGPGQVPGAATAAPLPQVAPVAAQAPAGRVAAAAGGVEAAFAEDGPTIARKRGLGYLSKGTIVDIRLYTRVNTSIPGVVVAEVVYDVWDIDQRYILIPRGSKLTGSSAQVGTDTEVGGKVVFDTFIDPTGREIPIAIPVVTSSRIGVTGVPGSIDYHWGRVFGGSAVLAVISAVGQGNQPAGANASMTQSDLMRQNMVQQTGQMGNQFMQRFIQIKPDITLEEGEASKIIILQHMMVKPFHKVF